jgi:hypothetical protein
MCFLGATSAADKRYSLGVFPPPRCACDAQCLKKGCSEYYSFIIGGFRLGASAPDSSHAAEVGCQLEGFAHE